MAHFSSRIPGNGMGLLILPAVPAAVARFIARCRWWRSRDMAAVRARYRAHGQQASAFLGQLMCRFSTGMWNRRAYTIFGGSCGIKTGKRASSLGCLNPQDLYFHGWSWTRNHSGWRQADAAISIMMN